MPESRDAVNPSGVASRGGWEGNESSMSFGRTKSKIYLSNHAIRRALKIITPWTDEGGRASDHGGPSYGAVGIRSRKTIPHAVEVTKPRGGKKRG